MTIDRPREPGPYAERELDCARALKASFDEEFGKTERAFLDVDSIAIVLTPKAVDAGWTEGDVRAAIGKLARNRQAADKDIRRMDPQL